jgi:hypothetical protein
MGGGQCRLWLTNIIHLLYFFCWEFNVYILHLNSEILPHIIYLPNMKNIVSLCECVKIYIKHQRPWPKWPLFLPKFRRQPFQVILMSSLSQMDELMFYKWIFINLFFVLNEPGTKTIICPAIVTEMNFNCFCLFTVPNKYSGVHMIRQTDKLATICYTLWGG